MARKPMMAGNWKMNNTVAEAVVLTQELSNRYREAWADRADVVICPPYVDPAGRDRADFDKTKTAVGAERTGGAFGSLHRRDIHPHDQGDRLHVLHRGPLSAGSCLARRTRT